MNEYKCPPNNPLKVSIEMRKKFYTVGDVKPEGEIKHMKYIGPVKRLYGKSALVGENGVAQFDDLNTFVSHGWYQFNIQDFVSE